MFFDIVFIYTVNLLLLTQVLSVCTSVIKFNEYITDVGSNISIPCLARGEIMWVKEECNETKEFVLGPNLTIDNVQTTDSGTYICLVNLYDADMMQPDGHISTSWSSDGKEQYKNQNEKISEQNYYEALTIILKVRSIPGSVTRLSVRLSTILGVLIWEFPANHSGGYPIKSFTAEFRKYAMNLNGTEYEWERLDPNNIPANVRYFEIYHLIPNTSYEFRLWANNYLGAGEIVCTSATTLSQLSDQELLDIVLKDVKNFDPRIWFYAVSISMSAMVVLGCTVCLLLLRDHYEELELRRQQDEEEWETIGIIPNIILNPGFYEPEDPNNPSPPYTRTIIFGEDVLSTSESGTDDEEPMSFKRKFSLFFTGDTIKRL